MTSAEEREIEITDVVLPDGHGIGRDGGLVLFVPATAPGDRVMVKITGKKANLAHCEVTSLLVASDRRAEPVCAHFGECGGCTLQHLSYGEQLRVKENHLVQAVRRLGNIDTEAISMEPITPSPRHVGYRGKVELAFGQRGRETVLGLRKQAGPLTPYDWPVTAISGCPIFGATAEPALPCLVRFAEKHNLTPYSPATGKGLLRHAILRESKATGEMMITLEVTKRTLPDLTRLWEDLRQALPALVSFYVAVNNGKGDMIDYRQSHHLFGTPYIEERLENLRFRVYPATFFQPNPEAAQLLHGRLVEWMTPWAVERLLGLYCGGGAMELILSRIARHVTGIDSEKVNIRTAVENCKLNRVTNCSFRHGSVEVMNEDQKGKPYDALVVDPPRTGLTGKALKVIVSLNAQRILYVSCNPATLARDLKVLKESHYRIERIAPFDFLPHTSHLETLVLLEKR